MRQDYLLGLTAISTVALILKLRFNHHRFSRIQYMPGTGTAGDSIVQDTEAQVSQHPRAEVAPRQPSLGSTAPQLNSTLKCHVRKKGKPFCRSLQFGSV